MLQFQETNVSKKGAKTILEFKKRRNLARVGCETKSDISDK
jgi:hypothetical protein